MCWEKTAGGRTFQCIPSVVAESRPQNVWVGLLARRCRACSAAASPSPADGRVVDRSSALTHSGGTAPDSHRTSLLYPSWAPKQGVRYITTALMRQIRGTRSSRSIWPAVRCPSVAACRRDTSAERRTLLSFAPLQRTNVLRPTLMDLDAVGIRFYIGARDRGRRDWSSSRRRTSRCSQSAANPRGTPTAIHAATRRANRTLVRASLRNRRHATDSAHTFGLISRYPRIFQAERAGSQEIAAGTSGSRSAACRCSREDVMGTE